MSRKLLAVASIVLSASFASTAFASASFSSNAAREAPGTRDYANTGIAGRGNLNVIQSHGVKARPYALTGRQVQPPRDYQTIRVGSRIVAVIPVDAR